MEKVKTQITSVKQVMVENIDKILEKGERIRLLQDKSTDLQENSNRFQVVARRVNTQFCQTHKKTIMAFTLTITGLVLVLVLIFTAQGKSSATIVDESHPVAYSAP